MKEVTKVIGGIGKMSGKNVLIAVAFGGSVGMASLAVAEKLTAEVRSIKGTPMLFINGKPYNPLIYMPGAWELGSPVPVRITKEWKRFETTFVMPENQPNASVHVRVGKVSGTTVWVDDVSLVDAKEPQKNLIVNGDFSDMNWEREWFLYIKEGAKATARVENGALRLDVDDGGKEFWHVHIFYRHGLNLKKGNRYIYSLRLRASEERDADILAVEQGGNWTVYTNWERWERTLRPIKYAAREGVNIYTFGIGMSWPRPGEKPNYRPAELAIERILLHDPQGLLIPRFDVEPSLWWKEKHPDDVMLWERPGDSRTVTLKSVKTTRSPLDWHRVKVELKSGSIKVYLNDQLELEYLDPQPLTSGRIALFSLHAKRCRFDDVKISDFAGNTLFYDDFSKGLKKWKVEEGGFHVEDGELVGEGTARLSAGENNWQDYVFEVKMKTDEVGIDVVTRKQEPYNVATLYFRYTDLEHRYFLIFRSDGRLELLKRHGSARLLTTEVEYWLEVWKKNQVSVASDAWRKEANEHLRRFIEHLESKYGDRIIGYHPCGQNTGEWFYQDSWHSKLNCCEPAFERAWGRWLARKYGTEDALRKAWGNPNITFEKVTVPSTKQRLNASLGFFRDPMKERQVIDFHEYQNIAMVEALEQFAKTIKEVTNRRKLVVYFYGYLFDLGAIPYGLQQSGHLALMRLLKCPDVDIICSPISYGDRGAGGIGAFMSPVDSVSLHGKLWLNEDDTRTHISPKNGRLDPALYGRTETPEQTYGVHQRNFAHILTRRMSCWWMDLFGDGWLDDDGIWQNLGKLKRIYDSVLGKPSSFKPEIAVIVDEKSNFYLTQNPPPITGHLLYHIRKSLYRIGAPVGFYLLEDLTSGLVAETKLYIFLNCFALTEQERKAIVKYCKGKVCVFFYGNGFIKDPSADVKNMEELLGEPMEMSMEKIEGTVKVVSHPLTGGVSDFGVEELQFSLSPVFYLDENRAQEAEVLAIYRDNGMPAVWIRKGKPYTAVYIGTLTAPASLLRNIAKSAGVHIYCHSDDVIVANCEFLSIHASSEGEKRLTLPRRATVQDALTGEVVGTNIRTWHVKMLKGETRMYKIK